MSSWGNLSLSARSSCAKPVLFGILFLSVTSRGICAEPIDLVIVSGQSNAVGYDTDPEKLAADPHDEKVLFWWRCGDPPPDDFDSVGPREWTTLQVQPRGNPNPDKAIPRQYGNFREPSGGFGPEVGFSREIVQSNGRKIAVLKVAFSGTSLLNDWNHHDEGAGGACYRALVSEYKLAQAEAAKQGLELRPRAFIWVQGESDAGMKNSQRYADALTDMVTTLRNDLHAPELLALVGVNTRFGGIEKITPEMQSVIDGQKAAAKADPRMLYVDCDGATLANGAHFDTAGTLEVGKRFAKAWLSFEMK